MDIPASPKCSARRLATALVPRLDGLKLEQISIDEQLNLISVSLRMLHHKAECPLCSRCSTRIHSQYARILTDLPWSSFTIRICLHVRRFFCAYSDCRRSIFTERLPNLARSYARRTNRQGEILRLMGLALGGRAGSRLLKRLQIQISPNTLLGLVRHTSEQSCSAPRVLGVDDFALRRGRTYGTILVDLEKHQPVDLLPGRTADLLTRWLKEHPGSQIITRDRSTEYARGITEGAPEAIQVADRFHILCNLRDALERVLDTNRSKLSGITLPMERERERTGEVRAPEQIHSGLAPELLQSKHEPEQMTSTEAECRFESQQRRRHRYHQARELHSQGADIKAIAKQLRLSRMTIYRYLRLDMDPVPVQRRPRPSMIDPYVPYLQQRWSGAKDGGCQNGGQLWRELKELGYPGSRKMLTVWVGQQRKRAAEACFAATTTMSMIPTAAPTSRRLAWFLVRDPQTLSMAERSVMAQLREKCKEVVSAYKLVHNFHRIMKGRLANELNAWLQAAKESGIKAMQNFALGIEKDKAAVEGALTHEWSNGQVEGQVNRLKLRKRQLYGRASFDLLRHYVLDTP